MDVTVVINAFTNQMRAIYALFMREMLTRYGDRKLGFLWSIVEPLAHVGVFWLIRYYRGFMPPDGVSLILFLVSGIIPFFYFRDVASKGPTALSSNQGLLDFPNLSISDFFVARYFLETAAGLLTFLMSIVVAFNLEPVINLTYTTSQWQINDALLVLGIFFLMGLIGFGWGLITSALKIFLPSVTIISNTIIRILYLTSGVIFSIKIIPERYYDILYYNPFVHCMEIIRGGFFQAYFPKEVFQDVNYVITFALILIFLGVILVASTKRFALR